MIKTPVKSDLFSKLVEKQFRVTVIPEFKFMTDRKFRIDYAIDPFGVKIALEVEGGAYIPGGGRHNRASSFIQGFEKYNLLSIHGWKLLRVTPQTLMSSATFDMIESILKNNSK